MNNLLLPIEASECNLTISSQKGKPITVTRAAVMLVQLAYKNPKAKVDFYLKVRV